MKLSRLIFSLLAAAALALVLALLDTSPYTGRDWLAYFLVTLIGAALGYLAWHATGSDRSLGRVALTAAFLRLAIGVTLMIALPVVGYLNNRHHQAGFFYEDAFGRNYRSWELAISGKPLLIAFSGEIPGDQYGGMMFLTALLYRTFGLDFHRPFLVLILNAAASVCGVLFLGYAARRWFGLAVAKKSAWALTLYPEAVLLSATHMREAYIIPLIAMSMFGLARIQEKHRDGWLWLLAAGLMLIGFSPLAMVVGFVVLLGFWLLAPAAHRDWKPLATLAAVLLVGVFAVWLAWSKMPAMQGVHPLQMAWQWIQSTIVYQSQISEKASGILQNLQGWVGPQFAWLMTMGYGMVQPLLPAVVGDPDAAWIMRLVGFFRGVGWYALAPLMVYAVVAIFRSRSEPRRGQLTWLVIFLWVWVAFTALIAGGDQWDNPRYRAFLLPWMVLLAAWAWQWALAQRDRWLGRWLAVEAFFVFSFAEWYITRYTLKFLHLGIREMIILNALAAAVILGSGLIQRKAKRVS
jgi:hypothetical protein